jgi:uncharacterized protein YndB with AHSA1/START domain
MTLEVRKTIELKASPDRVWNAITDPNELAQWFPDEHADFLPQEGHSGFFVWAAKEGEGDGCGGGSFAVEVEKAEPPHSLIWSWARQADIPFDRAATTRVEWTLTPRPDGGTRLELHETGCEKLLDREGNDSGWDAELGELVAYLEAAVEINLQRREDVSAETRSSASSASGAG